MSLLHAPPPPVLVPVAGTDGRFAVRRVFCVGRNYRSHAIEMGSDPDREPPFFFTKPADAIVTGVPAIAFASRTADLHHEVELVVALNAGGADIPLAQAARCVFGHAVGLDLTRRDLQTEAKNAGRPWDMAKGFDQSAPCGTITPVAGWSATSTAAIALAVNGQPRQSGTLGEMIWSVPEIIAELSTYVRLMPGDLIYTGTPEGVGPIQAGDRLAASIEGLEPLEIVIG